MARGAATPSDRGLRCPICGGAVQVERLVIEDDDVVEEVFVFECLQGDFRVALTRGRLHKIVTGALEEQVRQALR